MLLGSIPGSVSWGTPAQPSGVIPARVEVRNVSDPAPVATVDFVDVSPLVPVDSTQIVVLRVIVTTASGDVTLTLGDTVDAVEYSETVGEASTWSFTVPAHTADWVRHPIGWETTYLAPPPGLFGVAIEVDVSLLTGDVGTYRLMTNGQANASTRTISPDGHMLTVSGMGPEIRYDRVPVDLQLGPEHGNTHGEIIATLAELAGVPAENILTGNFGVALGNPVDIAAEQATGLWREIGEAVNQEVGFDRDGNLVAVPRAPNAGNPALVITAANVVADAEPSVDTVSEVPTCVIVEGSRSQLPENADGSVTTQQTITTFNDQPIRGAYFQQTSGGALNPLSPGGDTASSLRPVRRVTIRKTTIAGCPLRDEVITESFYNPESHRYTQDSAGVIAGYAANVYIFEPGAVADDGASAHLWPFDRFVETSRQQTDYEYPGGKLTTTNVRRGGWYNPRGALESRPNPAAAWGFIPLARMNGDGKGVSGVAEVYYDGPFDPDSSSPGATWLSRDETTITHTDDGDYVTREETEKTGYRISQSGGLLHRFDGEQVSSQLAETEGITGTQTTVNSADDSNTLTVITESRDDRGQLIPPGQVVTVDAGFLPAATVCDRESILRTSSVPISGKSTLVGNWHPFEQIVRSDWVETSDAAQAMAERIQREASPITITITLPIVPALRKLDELRLDMPVLGLVGDTWIHGLRHYVEAGDSGARALTEIVVKKPVM